MNHLIHVGLQKTASTFFQTHVWPAVARNNPRNRYLGKYIHGEDPVSVGFDPDLSELWQMLRSPGEDSDAALAAGGPAEALSALLDAADGRRVIISEEACTAQLLNIYRFDWMLNFFNRAGYGGDYLLVLRDPEAMIRTLAPSNLSVLLVRGYLRDAGEAKERLGADESVARLAGWLDYEINAARDGLPNLFDTTLNYRRILDTLGPERTWVFTFDQFISDPRPVIRFVEAAFEVDLTDLPLAAPTNTRDHVLKRISEPGVDTEIVRRRINAVIDDRLDTIASLDSFRQSAGLYRQFRDGFTGVFQATAADG